LDRHSCSYGRVRLIWYSYTLL